MFRPIYDPAQNSVVLIEGLSSRLPQSPHVVRWGQSKSMLPPDQADKGPSSESSRRRSVHDHHRCFHVPYKLAVCDARIALPNFYDVTVRIANVAACLTIFGLGLSDKHSSSTSP
jgi:hypothetical protein